MSSWRALANEFDRWADEGRAATLWWRDDDAAHPVRALDRLLALRSHAGVPLSLAVIPATVADATAAVIEAADRIDILQHGYAHRNHAPPGKRKAELGEERPADRALAELCTGRQRLGALFGARSLDVLVPPWNRIAVALVDRLGAAGFAGLSAYGPRAHAIPTAGLRQVNAHIDIIDWRATRGFVGVGEALALAVGHLRARRAQATDGDEPTGLLSHHRVHDEAAWSFVTAFLEATAAHPGARWVSAGDAFAARGRSERVPGP